MKKKTLSLEQLDRRIARIHKKIEKERKNILDSGFVPNTDEFNDLFWEIKLEYVKDLAPILHQRDDLQPFDEKQREEYNILLSIIDYEELKKVEAK